MKIRGKEVRPALLVIDVQNGFVSKGGSYDELGMDIANYQSVVPRVSRLIELCRRFEIPIFYTQAVREKSGIDLLTRSHKILPKSREERIKRKPICIAGTWDAEIVKEVSPAPQDHVVIKRRDSAFHDTEIDVWLQSLGVDTILFCGIDTSICVEASFREAFNQGYDIILVSDATASANQKHYQSTVEVAQGYYGWVMDTDELIKDLSPQYVLERNTKGTEKTI
jgi:ureidoacrylate peracid hydrolase